MIFHNTGARLCICSACGFEFSDRIPSCPRSHKSDAIMTGEELMETANLIFALGSTGLTENGKQRLSFLADKLYDYGFSKTKQSSNEKVPSAEQTHREFIEHLGCTIDKKLDIIAKALGVDYDG